MLNYLRSNWPKVFFLCYLAAVLLALVWFQPGWGFMDDARGIKTCQEVWSGQYSPLDLVFKDEIRSGRFRPLYQIYAIFIYLVPLPVLIYYFGILIGFLCLAVWGKILAAIYSLPEDDKFSVYVYPLLFFSFIPFWNIFMFVSIQEKFLYFFSTFAIYQLIRAYQTAHLKGMLLALTWAVLGLGFKETGLALIFSFFVFAVIDLIWFHMAPRLSCYLAGISGCVLAAYVVFISHILGGYTSSYKAQSGFYSLFNKLWHMPLLFHIFLAGLFLSCFLVRKDKPGHPRPYFLIIPCYVITFFSLLLPWHFYLYLLSPLGPFVMAWVFCFCLFAMRAHVWSARAIRVVIVVLIILNFFNWIIPCLSKMGDKPRITDMVKDIAQKEPRAKFFYPPPIEETAGSLGLFTRARIVYTNRIRVADLKDCGGSCYLLTNDENDPVRLDPLVLAGKISDIGTWRIHYLFIPESSK